MKTDVHAAIQFSGYALIVAVKEHRNKTDVNLSPVASSQKKISKNEQHNITNNPENWDAGWFSNYE